MNNRFCSKTERERERRNPLNVMSWKWVCHLKTTVSSTDVVVVWQKFWISFQTFVSVLQSHSTTLICTVISHLNWNHCQGSWRKSFVKSSKTFFFDYSNKCIESVAVWLKSGSGSLLQNSHFVSTDHFIFTYNNWINKYEGIYRPDPWTAFLFWPDPAKKDNKKKFDVNEKVFLVD